MRSSASSATRCANGPTLSAQPEGTPRSHRPDRRPAGGADPATLPAYEEIISTGAWGDLADGVAGRVCGLLQAHRPDMTGWVVGFVAEHAAAMSPLSHREALRRLAAAGRD
ncbi:hypothetical protein [Pseudarthrobacter sp. NamE2]|uniref:hypothetical protein n=1 Tax=Pseudarthrobacter sp. NamE2 TaxID=2576838 RepID=UPI001F114803|nr:hypothetical protein [Pseudarthrobacter sp. NamE2]